MVKNSDSNKRQNPHWNCGGIWCEACWGLRYSITASYRMIMHMAVRMRKQIKISHNYYWHSSSRCLWFHYASSCKLPGVTVVALLLHLKWHAKLLPCGACKPDGILMLTPNFSYNELVRCSAISVLCSLLWLMAIDGNGRQIGLTEMSGFSWHIGDYSTIWTEAACKVTAKWCGAS